MKVKELIAQLQMEDGEAEVCIAQPSHDYCGSVCAIDVDYIELADVAWSEYHGANKVIDDDRIDYYEKEELKNVVLLS